MTRALCRRRTGEALVWAEKSGDLITADQKVLNEGCESRDNHRYAVVVQDLAAQWIQSHPCKTKTPHETERSFSKFLEPSHRPNGDVLIADLEDLEKLDESEICLRRVNAEEVLISPKGDQFIFPVAAGAAKLSVRDFEIREPTPRREQTVRSEDFSEELQGEPGRSQPTESTDDAEARADFWSIQGDFINRHHSEPRVQLRAEGRNILDSTEIH